MAVNSNLSVGISQSSDFTPQSYPNEPLDSTEAASCALIRACQTASSLQSCACRLLGNDSGSFSSSISLWPHESPTSRPVAASATLHQRRHSATLRQWWGNTESLDAIQDRCEQLRQHRNLGHVECGLPKAASITRRHLFCFRGEMNQAEITEHTAPRSALPHFSKC